MRKLVLLFLVLGFSAIAVAASAVEPVRTDIPAGVDPAQPGGDPRVECDREIRYDDGGDDSPGSSPTLGWYGPNAYQYLGVRFTVDASQSYRVQSASWFSDFWITPGLVDVTVTEVGNPANTATATVNVPAGGTYGVDFADPICIPAGGEYVVMLCPQPFTFGVVGEDLNSPDFRSYWSSTTCDPVNDGGPVDYMIWSCVTPCGPTPADIPTWGSIKSLYR